MKKMFFYVLLTFTIISCGGTAENLTEGNEAPDFTLQDSENNTYKLSDYRNNSPVIIYFYPKANTPGCTKQACGIRDDFSKFEENGIKIFGISVDSKESIKDFVNEYQLNFPLLSDESKAVSEKYGVLNKLGVASRITFVVDKSGKIAKIIRDIDLDSHANEVFEIAKSL